MNGKICAITINLMYERKMIISKRLTPFVDMSKLNKGREKAIREKLLFEWKLAAEQEKSFIVLIPTENLLHF